MTSLAFILGHAAGYQYWCWFRRAERSRYRCNGGMVTATVLAIFFVPVFFVVVRRRFSRKNEDIEHSHTVDHH
ncbi:hypothetical protein ACVXG9_24500 [Escherichia coli]